MFGELPKLDDSQAPGYILDAKKCPLESSVEGVYDPEFCKITIYSDGTNDHTKLVGKLLTFGLVKVDMKLGEDRIVQESSAILVSKNESVSKIEIFEGMGPFIHNNNPGFGLCALVYFLDKTDGGENGVVSVMVLNYKDNADLNEFQSLSLN